MLAFRQALHKNTHMTEIHLPNRFLDIDPKMDIAAHDIRLLGVDVENVLCDYGNSKVFDGVARHVESILEETPWLKIVLITNKKSTAFIDEVVSQLPGGDIPYLNPNEGLGLKKKPSPSMFKWAVEQYGDLYHPERAAHVDDQFKAFRGAQLAGFGHFFWTKPMGEHQHRGVKAFRPVELGIIRPIVSAANWTRETKRVGIFGD